MIFRKKSIGAVLLISGTCIGAGMLALPVKTAAIGLYPALLLLLLVWLVMTISALLMLEINLALPRCSNIISMAQATLGSWGRYIVWLVYLLFFYSLLAAYTSGGVAMLHKTVVVLSSGQFCASVLQASCVFVVPLALIVYCGTKISDYVNRILMLGVVVTFVVLLKLIAQDYDFVMLELLDLQQLPGFSSMLMALPIIVTSFGFHHLVPSMRDYLNSDLNKLRFTIILGGLIPLIIYGIWLAVVFFLVPMSGDNGLLSMLHSSQNQAALLVTAVSHGNPFVLAAVAGFSFFVLVTSFIGVSLGLVDFLSDGLKLPKTAPNRVLLVILTFLPPVIYTMLYPQGFLSALSYGGVFAAILLIIYPALMVWRGRYSAAKVLKTEHYQVFGGKLLLVLVLSFGLLVVLAELQ